MGPEPAGTVKLLTKCKVALRKEELELDMLLESRESNSSRTALGCFPAGLSFSFTFALTIAWAVWGTVFFFFVGGSTPDVTELT
jgi:hypothetical protein